PYSCDKSTFSPSISSSLDIIIPSLLYISFNYIPYILHNKQKFIPIGKESLDKRHNLTSLKTIDMYEVAMNQLESLTDHHLESNFLPTEDRQLLLHHDHIHLVKESHRIQNAL